jgi:hypothetical protein
MVEAAEDMPYFTPFLARKASKRLIPFSFPSPSEA